MLAAILENFGKLMYLMSLRSLVKVTIPRVANSELGNS